jgi:hypothetical protein
MVWVDARGVRSAKHLIRSAVSQHLFETPSCSSYQSARLSIDRRAQTKETSQLITGPGPSSVSAFPAPVTTHRLDLKSC